MLTPVSEQLKQVQDSVKVNASRRSKLLKDSLKHMVDHSRTDQAHKVRAIYQQRWADLKQLITLRGDSIPSFKLPPLLSLSPGGQVSLSRQIGRREGNYPAAAPVSYTRFMFNGGIQVLSLPLRINALYTTEQQGFRQPMNQFGVSIDVAQIKQNIQFHVAERVRILEKLSRPEELKHLSRLQSFYREHGLSVANTEDLKQYMRQALALDSIQRLPQHLLNQAQDSLRGVYLAQERYYRWQLEQKKDSLSALYRAKGEAAAGPRAQSLKKTKAYRWRNALVQDSLVEAWTQKGRLHDISDLRKIQQSVRRENLSWQELKKWQQYRDSLQKVDPERLLQWAELDELKQVTKGDPEAGLRVLRKYNLMPPPVAFLLGNVKTLRVGTSYPHFSKYILRGVPLTGTQVAFQPGKFYAEYTGSRNLNAIPERTIYARKLQAGRVGVGSPEGNHFHLIALRGEDNAKTFRGDTLVAGLLDTTFYNKPRKNYVLGGDFKLALHKRVSLTGEWARSSTAMNLYTGDVSLGEAGQQLFTTSAGDTAQHRSGWAYGAELEFTLTKHTTLKLRGESLDKGFYSLGAPFLRNDVNGYECRLDQYLFKRKLRITPQAGRWQTMGADTLPRNHTLQTVGGKANLSLPKLPQLTFSHLTSTLAGRTLNGANRTTQVQAAHHYYLHSVSCQSTLSWSDQRNAAQAATWERVAAIRQLTYQQQWQLPSGIGAAANGAVQRVVGTPYQGRWVSYGGTFSYAYRGIWQTSLGVMQGSNQTAGIRQNHFAEARVLMRRRIDIVVRAEKNVFRNGGSEQDYREWLGNVTLSSRF